MFCKPDKGNGVIVLDRADYNNKMYNIIHDQLKFKPLSEDQTGKRKASLQTEVPSGVIQQRNIF